MGKHTPHPYAQHYNVGAERQEPHLQPKRGVLMKGRCLLHKYTDRKMTKFKKNEVKRVQKKGCKLFSALIQEQNVHFFTKLGWKARGPMEEHFGRLHQYMTADLDQVPGDL